MIETCPKCGASTVTLDCCKSTVARLKDQLASALRRAEAAETDRASLLAFCRSRIEQCADMEAQGVPHPGSFREGRVAAFLAVIGRLDSAPVKP